MKTKMKILRPGRHYIIGTIKLEIYVSRNLREDTVEVEVKPFNSHKERLRIQKESYPFYVYIFKNKDSNTVIGESLLTGNTLFIRKKRVDEVFKELRQIKL